MLRSSRTLERYSRGEPQHVAPLTVCELLRVGRVFHPAFIPSGFPYVYPTTRADPHPSILSRLSPPPPDEALTIYVNSHLVFGEHLKLSI